MSDLKPGRYYLPVNVGEWHDPLQGLRLDAPNAPEARARHAGPLRARAYSDGRWEVYFAAGSQRITWDQTPETDLPSAMDAADAALAGLLVPDLGADRAASDDLVRRADDILARLLAGEAADDLGAWIDDSRAAIGRALGVERG